MSLYTSAPVSVLCVLIKTDDVNEIERLCQKKEDCWYPFGNRYEKLNEICEYLYSIPIVSKLTNKSFTLYECNDEYLINFYLHKSRSQNRSATIDKILLVNKVVISDSPIEIKDTDRNPIPNRKFSNVWLHIFGVKSIPTIDASTLIKHHLSNEKKFEDKIYHYQHYPDGGKLYKSVIPIKENNILLHNLTSKKNNVQKIQSNIIKKVQSDNNLLIELKKYRDFPALTLQELCERKPITLKELRLISGFGKKSINLYGETVINIIQNWLIRNNETSPMTNLKKDWKIIIFECVKTFNNKYGKDGIAKILVGSYSLERTAHKQEYNKNAINSPFFGLLECLTRKTIRAIINELIDEGKLYLKETDKFYPLLCVTEKCCS